MPGVTFGWTGGGEASRGRKERMIVGCQMFRAGTEQTTMLEIPEKHSLLQRARF